MMKHFLPRFKYTALAALVFALASVAGGETVSLVSYVDAAGQAQVCAEAMRVSSSDSTWSSGWHVVDSTLTVGDRIVCEGDVRLILADESCLTASKGITVSGSSSLVIYAQINGTGELTACGSDYNAAIGGVYGESTCDSGPIVINGGIITATASGSGAGIGAGNGGNGRNITINRGKVTAKCSGMYAAGIGGSIYGEGANVTINGGTVIAAGGLYAAGIGGGYQEAPGTGVGGSHIRINGGRVSVTGIGGAGIGGGVYGRANDIVISNACVSVCAATVTASGIVLTPDLIGCGALPKGEGAMDGIVISDTAKVCFNLTGAAKYNVRPKGWSWSAQCAAMPEDFDGYVIMTPETQTAGRVLVGGTEDWTAAQSFTLTNTVTGVTTATKVGEVVQFVGTYLMVRQVDDDLSLRVPVRVQVGDDAWAFIDETYCAIVGSGDMWPCEKPGTSALWGYRTSIERVVITDGVTDIGKNAFSYMKGLCDVEIGGAITNIGRDAFYFCTGVTNLIVGAGVQKVGENAFERCNSLERVSLGRQDIMGMSDAFKTTSRITIIGGRPVIDLVPEVVIEGYVRVLKGKADLGDKEWVEVADEKEIPPELHFFKYEFKANPVQE